MSTTDELAQKLAHRQGRIEATEEELNQQQPVYKFTNVYTEFKEFTRKQIKDYESIFKKYDNDKNNCLDQHELQIMMEKLGAPQTFLGLKEMIKEVDEDQDGMISFREFLLIFRKAAAGELAEDSGLAQLAKLMEINVDEVGVKGAKDFFEAKAKDVAAGSKFEAEILAEQEERRREEEEGRQRKIAFQAKKGTFSAQ